MRVTILGTSSGGPFHGRHYTAQVLEAGKHVFLLDCGEGTQMQIFKYRIKVDACRQIFISHLHGDHVFGLMGLITNWSLKKRTEPLALYAPPGLRELVETMLRICSVRMGYTLEFHEVNADQHQIVFENETVEVWSVPLLHRCAASGWVFREKPKARNMRPEKIESLNIPFSAIPAIKAGADYQMPNGQIIPNSELTLDPSSPRSYAFCSDTAYSETVAECVRGVDLLYHEATFTDQHIEQAAYSFHSTARHAATIAAKAGVGRLLLGHISGRYDDTAQHLAEAKSIFEAVEMAEEGKTWAV